MKQMWDDMLKSNNQLRVFFAYARLVVCFDHVLCRCH